MSTTQPIRSKNDLKTLEDFYFSICPNPRNYCLINLALNTALRITDLLQLCWEDVHNFSSNSFVKHLNVTEKKTKKINRIALNAKAVQVLTYYKKYLDIVTRKDFLFPGRNKNLPLSRSQAFRIIRKASFMLHLEYPVSCHSLRKTFGYHAWKKGIPPVMLMAIYNHSSFQITKRYLGIEQADKDDIFLNLLL